MCSGSGDWIHDHKKELEIGGAALGTALTAGALAPAMFGLGGAAAGATAAGTDAAATTAAGAGAADLAGTAAASQPATSGLASAALQAMGHMGPEQANILAAQNAAFGMQAPAANLQTLAAANPTINATLGQHGLIPTILHKAQPLIKGMAAAQQIMGADRPPQVHDLPPPPGYGKFPSTTSAEILAAHAPQGPSAGQLPPGMTLEQYLRLKQMGMV